MIPAEAVAAVIRPWIDEKDRGRTNGPGKGGSFYESGVTMLAHNAGVHYDVVMRIMGGRRAYVRHATADRLVTAVDRQDAWHLELAEWFE